MEGVSPVVFLGVARMRLPRTNRNFLKLMAILSLSLLLRMYAAATLGIARGDEYGTAASARSLAEDGEFTGWTMRSYFYPTLLAVFGKICLLLGEPSFLLMIPIYSIHGYWIFINRVFNVVLGVVGIFLTYKLGEACFREEVGLLAAFLQGINCLDIFWGMRSVPDPSSTPFLVASLLLLVKAQNDRPKLLFFLSGVFLGVSVMCRYSTALYIIPVIALILLMTEFRKGFWFFAAGVAVTAVLQGILDFITWGSFFRSSIDFFTFNIMEGQSLTWGYKPFRYYYEMLPIIFGHTFPLPLLALKNRNWRNWFLASSGALFLYVMSSIPHKEVRFLLTIIPLLCILSAQAILDHEGSRFKRAILFSLVGLTVVWQCKRYAFFLLVDPTDIFY